VQGRVVRRSLTEGRKREHAFSRRGRRGAGERFFPPGETRSRKDGREKHPAPEFSMPGPRRRGTFKRKESPKHSQLFLGGKKTKKAMNERTKDAGSTFRIPDQVSGEGEGGGRF